MQQSKQIQTCYLAVNNRKVGLYHMVNSITLYRRHFTVKYYKQNQ